jgi:hypothetical protein
MGIYWLVWAIKTNIATSMIRYSFLAEYAQIKAFAAAVRSGFV